MSQLEECSFEEKEEESPMLDSNLKRKDVSSNATNVDNPRNGETNADDAKKNITTTKADNEAAERGRSTGKKQMSTRKSFGKHFGQVSHSKSITTIPSSSNTPYYRIKKVYSQIKYLFIMGITKQFSIESHIFLYFCLPYPATQVKRKRNNSLMKNFCTFSDGSNHEQMMKQMYDESLVEWRKFQNSRIIEPKKMQTKEMMNGATKPLQLSVGGQKKFTLKDLQKLKKEENGNQEEEDKDVKSIGMAVRRKSCCCSHCGQLNSQQLQLVDVPFVPTQHKKFYDIKYRIKTILAAPIRPPIRSNNPNGGGTIIIQKSQPSNMQIEGGFPNSPHALHSGNNNTSSTHRPSYIMENNTNNGLPSNTSRPIIKQSKIDNYGFSSVVSNTSIDRSPKNDNNNSHVQQKQNQVVKFKARSSQRESSIFNSVALLPVHSMEENIVPDQEQKNNYTKTPTSSGFQKNLQFKAKKSLESKQLAVNKNQQLPESVLERSLKERNRGMRALENVLHNTTKGSTSLPQGDNISASSSIVRDQYQIGSQQESVNNANKKKQSTPLNDKGGNDFKRSNQNDLPEPNPNQNGEQQLQSQQQQSQPPKPQQRLMESLTQFRDRYIRQFREHPINPHGSSQDKHQIMRDSNSASTSTHNGFPLSGNHKHTNHLVLQGEKQDQQNQSMENLVVFSDTHSAALSSPYFVELKGEEYRFDQNFNKKNVYQRVFSPPFPEGIQLERHNYSPSRPETLHSQRKQKNQNQLNSNNLNGAVNSAYFSLSHHRRNLSSSDLFSKTHKESSSTSTARSAKFSCYYKPFKTIKTNNLQNVPEMNGMKKRQQQQSQQIQGVQLQVLVNSNGGNVVTAGSNVNSNNNINATNLPVISSNLKGLDNMVSSQQNSLGNNSNNNNNNTIQHQELGNQQNQVKVQQQMPSVQKQQSFRQHKRSNQSSLSNPKSILDSLLQENQQNKQLKPNSNSSSKRVLIKPIGSKDGQNNINNNNIQGATNLVKRDNKQQQKI